MTISASEFLKWCAVFGIAIGGGGGGVTYPLSLANGGTANDLSAQVSNGGVVWSNATGMQILAAPAASKKMLLSGGTNTAPYFSPLVMIDSIAANQVMYGSATNTIGVLTPAANTVLAGGVGGVPGFTATPQLNSLGIGVAASGTTGRLQTTGISRFGDSSVFTTIASHEFVWVSAVGSFINVYLTGNMTNVSAGGSQAAFEIQTSFNSNSGSWANADAIFLNPTFQMSANLPRATGIRIIPNASQGSGFTQGILANFYSSAATTSGFAGTLTNFYGFYAEAVNIGTNRYGAFFNAPSSSGAAVAIAAYMDNFTVGYTTVTPNTNSALIQGSLSLGTSAPVSNTRFTAFMNASDNFGINIQGTSSLVSNTPIALSIFPTLNAGSAGGQNVYAIQNNTTFGAPTAGAVSAIGYYGTGVVSLLGNLTTYYGIKLDAPTKTGAGVAATAYQLFLTKPTFATTNYTAVFGTGVGIGTSTPINVFDVVGNMSVGTSVAAPSNGLTVSGQSLFRTSSSVYGGSVEIGGADRISFALVGTKTATDGSSQIGFILNPTFAPTSSTTSVSLINTFAQVNPPTGVTIGTAYSAYFQNGAGAGAGTTTKGINVRIDQAAFGTTGYALSVQGGVIFRTDASATDITITTANYYVGITSTAAPRTATLPATVPDDGWECVVKDESGNALVNNITVSGNGHNINGSASTAINTNYGFVRVTARNNQYWTN